MICETPHILVWARVGTERRYWPARALAMRKSSRIARIHVRFFSKSKLNAYVDPADCYLFSRTDPNGVNIDIQQHPVNRLISIRLIFR